MNILISEDNERKALNITSIIKELIEEYKFRYAKNIFSTTKRLNKADHFGNYYDVLIQDMQMPLREDSGILYNAGVTSLLYSLDFKIILRVVCSSDNDSKNLIPEELLEKGIKFIHYNEFNLTKVKEDFKDLFEELNIKLKGLT